jgi:AraC-like DNA-binding protein
MRPAADEADFLHRPLGRYLVAPSWIAFYADEGISGFMLWGSPGAPDLTGLMRVLPVSGSILAAPMPRWVDVRRLEPRPSAFAVFAEYFAANAEALGRCVTRAAALHGGGLVGAMVAGLGAVIPTRYPLRTFNDSDKALSWLGLPEASFVRELDEVQAAAIGTAALLSDLRAWLSSQLAGASLADAATALGTSQRSLQRRLRGHGTSFLRELSRTRVEVAKGLLRETDQQITAIAYEVGCSSVHHFGELFRRETGTRPTTWRMTQR